MQLCHSAPLWVWTRARQRLGALVGLYFMIFLLLTTGQQTSAYYNCNLFLCMYQLSRSQRVFIRSSDLLSPISMSNTMNEVWTKLVSDLTKSFACLVNRLGNSAFSLIVFFYGLAFSESFASSSIMVSSTLYYKWYFFHQMVAMATPCSKVLLINLMWLLESIVAFGRRKPALFS